MIFRAFDSKRTAEDREILRENVDKAAIDSAVAGDKAVARGPLSVQPNRETGGGRIYRVPQMYPVRVEKVYAFTGAELSFLALAGDRSGPPPSSASYFAGGVFDSIGVVAMGGHGWEASGEWRGARVERKKVRGDDDELVYADLRGRRRLGTVSFGSEIGVVTPLFHCRVSATPIVCLQRVTRDSDRLLLSSGDGRKTSDEWRVASGERTNAEDL